MALIFKSMGTSPGLREVYRTYYGPEASFYLTNSKLSGTAAIASNYVSGTKWVIGYPNGGYQSNNRLGFYQNTYAGPFFVYNIGSYTLADSFDTDTVFSYGWGIGNVVYGYSDYGRNIGYTSGGGPLIMDDNYGSGLTWTIRQIMYNASLNSIAIRMTLYSGGPMPGSTYMDRIHLNSWSSTYLTNGLNTNSAQYTFVGNQATALGTYLVGSDYTFVHMYNGSLPTSGQMGANFWL